MKLPLKIGNYYAYKARTKYRLVKIIDDMHYQDVKSGQKYLRIYDEVSTAIDFDGMAEFQALQLFARSVSLFFPTVFSSEVSLESYGYISPDGKYYKADTYSDLMDMEKELCLRYTNKNPYEDKGKDILLRHGWVLLFKQSVEYRLRPTTKQLEVINILKRLVVARQMQLHRYLETIDRVLAEEEE